MSFSRCATTALSYLSASWPPSDESMKYGAMSVAVAKVASAAPLSPPTCARMNSASAALNKLSSNAAKNWHQNKGANRRETISGARVGVLPQGSIGGAPVVRCHQRETQAKSKQQERVSRTALPIFQQKRRSSTIFPLALAPAADFFASTAASASKAVSRG